MTIFLLVVALIVALLFIYALVLRPWLKVQPWAAGFFAYIDRIELALFKKSETVLVGRLLWVGSGIVTLYDTAGVFFSSLDLTPIQTRVFDALHVPADLRGTVLSAFVAALGFMMVYLRKQVTKPLELVAVADKDVTPKVAEAIAMADATAKEAVVVAKDAKAS